MNESLINTLAGILSRLHPSEITEIIRRAKEETDGSGIYGWFRDAIKKGLEE